MLNLKNIARGGLAVAAVLAVAAPAWAGQVNLSARSTVITETIGGSVVTQGGGSISGTVDARTLNSTVVNSIIRNVTITETFQPNTATVSFEIEQDDINYSSPFDNVFSGTVVATINATTTSGVTAVQSAIGAGNVSVSANGLLDATGLTDIVALMDSFPNAQMQTAVLALVPGMAVQNSNINALVQAAANAIAGSSGTADAAVPVTAIDAVQTGLNEFSPHGNVAAMGSVALTVNAAGASGVSTVQTQVGAGNVQTSYSSILFSSNDGTAAIYPNP